MIKINKCYITNTGYHAAVYKFTCSEHICCVYSCMVDYTAIIVKVCYKISTRQKVYLQFNRIDGKCICLPIFYIQPSKKEFLVYS